MARHWAVAYCRDNANDHFKFAHRSGLYSVDSARQTASLQFAGQGTVHCLPTTPTLHSGFDARATLLAACLCLMRHPLRSLCSNKVPRLQMPKSSHAQPRCFPAGSPHCHRSTLQRSPAASAPAPQQAKLMSISGTKANRWRCDHLAA